MPASAPPSPDELLAQYRAQGDPEALGALFDAVAPTLHRIALSLLSNVHDADDALQATFLALLQHPDRPDPDRPVVPWLVGVLRNEVLRLRRASRHRDAPPAPSVDANASLADDADVRKALEELPEPYRAPSLLRWRYGLTPAQIAHVRDEAPGTTRSLLARALAQLRRRLRGRLAGVAPFAGGLSEVRASVLKAASAARASATRVTLWSSIMTTKQVVLATLVGAAALGAVTVWLATQPSEAQTTRGNDDHVARAREATEDPHVPMLQGLPVEATSGGRAGAATAAQPAAKEEPAAVEDPAWPTPENLRAILDARVMTEAVLGAIEGVNQALRPRVPVRLVTFDSGYKTAHGEVRADSSIMLDATTSALSALKMPVMGMADFFELSPTAAKFKFREATAAQSAAEPPGHGTWEPAEAGEDLASERLIAMIGDAGVRRTGPIHSDPALHQLGLQRRQCDIRAADLSDAMLRIRKLDAIRGVRVTRVHWKTNDATGEVSATCFLTLRLAGPAK